MKNVTNLVKLCENIAKNYDHFASYAIVVRKPNSSLPSSLKNKFARISKMGNGKFIASKIATV